MFLEYYNRLSKYCVKYCSYLVPIKWCFPLEATTKFAYNTLSRGNCFRGKLNVYPSTLTEGYMVSFTLLPAINEIQCKIDFNPLLLGV